MNKTNTIVEQSGNAVQGAMPLLFVELSEALGRYEHTVVDTIAISKIIPPQEFPLILDICCGIGRLSHALSNICYTVIGIDLSIKQLEVARRQKSKAIFQVCDMITPPVGPFDAIVNVYTSFGYAENEAADQEVLSAWFHSLRHGGRIIMELSDMERASCVLEPDSYTYRDKNGVKEALIVKDKMLTVDYEFKGQNLTCKTRLYWKEELKEMLINAGFSNIQLYGSFDLTAKEPRDNLIIVAERP
ncbi:ubiquinone/menaquinone biosynthesis methyltransferase [Serratia ficaria]|uniref:class I SAM-dependent DNA methyltransferase n=1 Tax=Serratia ficaria TaxID=61651 RepID=UPI0021831D09|nr:class I SAM-dependent methyltransferase [Serratia ficaria]CAI2535030.1 ubiquinone/menaquinone biosynthesis methyltransferase [Serratia ficaria]